LRKLYADSARTDKIHREAWENLVERLLTTS
jgi:hypothetical protein